ncbi:unnamed protein product [Microthlaspi erraticum]|uniref:FBD domain-containing protein n=1 Tax=Microthlaspi erraticum TaxID=1685480 RepID=A0A6D2JV49_9BRAS|nr:unnamed protein product [Microthlaspi erraticum]
MTLKLEGAKILVDVSPTVCLPSLKTLQLRFVTYLDEDSPGLLLSHCPVLEDLLIERNDKYDNMRAFVVNVPSLQRLYLHIGPSCSFDGYSIVTPSLKYFKIVDHRDFYSYLFEPMLELEEADIEVKKGIEKILESIKSVRRLSLRSWIISGEELEHLKLRMYRKDWSKLLVWFLENSPKLRVLNLHVGWDSRYKEYEPVDLKNKESTVPECLLRSLETFEFSSYMQTQEQIDFFSFFFKHARCLKSTSIIHQVP